MFKCEYYHIGKKKKTLALPFPLCPSTFSSYNEKQINTPCYIRASPH